MALTLLDLSEAKQKLAALTIERLRLDNPEFNDSDADIFTGMKTASGQTVTREKAMRTSAVLSCVRILMEDVYALPLLLKRKTATGATDAVDEPLYRILKSSPNPFQTSMEVREHVMLDLLLTGRGACWQQRDKSGKMLALWPLHASRLTFQGQHKNGDLNWNYSSPEISREFTQHELWRTVMMSQYIVDGRALIMLAREAIGLAIAAEEQGARLFSNGIQTDIVLTCADELDEDGRSQLQKSLASTYSGSKNAWKALLLENGLNASKIGLTAQESQYIEARNYQMQDIARIFRIPGVMLGLGDKTNTYASAEQFFLAYVKFTIQPWIRRFEETIERDLILPSQTDLFVKHQLKSLLRSDQKTRFENYNLGITAGFLNRNECRIEEDLDTVPELDAYLVPMNMGEAGAEDTAEAGNPAQNSGKAVPNAPKNQPQDPAKGRASALAEALAANIADSLIQSETKWFIRNLRSVRSLGDANFRAWHHGRVVEMTGANAADVESYTAWRLDDVTDPLSDSSREAARERIINLCLGVTL